MHAFCSWNSGTLCYQLRPHCVHTLSRHVYFAPTQPTIKRPRGELLVKRIRRTCIASTNGKDSPSDAGQIQRLNGSSSRLHPTSSNGTSSGSESDAEEGRPEGKFTRSDGTAATAVLAHKLRRPEK